MSLEVRRELQEQRHLVHELLRDHAAGLLGEVYPRLYDENGDRTSTSTAEVAAALGHQFPGAVDQTLRLCELLLGERDLPEGPSMAKKWRGLVRTLMATPKPLDPRLQRVLTKLTTALAQAEVQTDDDVADDVSSRVIDALRAAPSGLDRETIAREVGLEPEATYHVLKGLRESDIVVTQGHPLVYKLAGDPTSDRAEGWRSGIGSQGRRADPVQLNTQVLSVLADSPGATLGDLQEVDELVDFSSYQIYGALRRLEATGQVGHEGRPHQYFVVTNEQEAGGAATPPETPAAGEADTISDDEMSARREMIRDWYDREKWRHESLLRESEEWLRDLLARDTRTRKDSHQDHIPFDQALIDSRMKSSTSFVHKAARQCGVAGKLCRRCRVVRDDRPHFYYQGATADEICQQIEDFVGLRLMVPSHQDQTVAVDLLMAEGHQPEETAVGVDAEYPTYRATHVVLTVPGARSGLEANRVEIQIRTVLQDAAARIEHALLYKDGQPSKRELRKDELRHLRTIFGQMELAESVFNQLLER